MERKELFRALFGSQNYNLARKANPILGTPESDKDYKAFFVPSFDDLYYKKEFKCNTISNTVDVFYEDIRKLERHLTNMNWLELLYSEEIIFNENITVEEYLLLKELIDMRDEISVMNLSYLFDTTIGMHIERAKKIHHYSESCKYMEELFGYNVKEAAHAYRLIDTLIKFADQGFHSFESVLKYEEGERKDYFMKIINGEISEEIMVKTLNGAKNYANENYADHFHAFEKNSITETKVKQIIYNLIKLNIAKVS